MLDGFGQVQPYFIFLICYIFLINWTGNPSIIIELSPSHYHAGISVLAILRLARTVRPSLPRPLSRRSARPLRPSTTFLITTVGLGVMCYHCLRYPVSLNCIAGLGFVCFFLNPLVLSANRVDFGLFFVSFYPPPPSRPRFGPFRGHIQQVLDPPVGFINYYSAVIIISYGVAQ